MVSSVITESEIDDNESGFAASFLLPRYSSIEMAVVSGGKSLSINSTVTVSGGTEYHHEYF